MRETVWSISGVNVGALREAFHSTRGPERMYRWSTSSLYQRDTLGSYVQRRELLKASK